MNDFLMWLAVAAMTVAVGLFYAAIFALAVLYTFRWPLVVVAVVSILAKVM